MRPRCLHCPSESRPVTTDGAHRTSSASEPGMVAAMLDCLDMQEGQRVLEIGTGTGYNAALLAHRLGSSQVTTVEIDPVIAGAAKTALDAAGYSVATIIGDGAAGWPAGAPYDRVIATVAAHLGALPYEWVRQTASGGVIATPMRTDYVGSGPLVRFTVDDDGLATGCPSARWDSCRCASSAPRMPTCPAWTRRSKPDRRGH
jgi:protein-L-isoaspartate(D-aspartate) O-methyltransferase